MGASFTVSLKYLVHQNNMIHHGSLETPRYNTVHQRPLNSSPIMPRDASTSMTIIGKIYGLGKAILTFFLFFYLFDRERFYFDTVFVVEIAYYTSILWGFYKTIYCFILYIYNIDFSLCLAGSGSFLTRFFFCRNCLLWKHSIHQYFGFHKTMYCIRKKYVVRNISLPHVVVDLLYFDLLYVGNIQMIFYRSDEEMQILLYCSVIVHITYINFCWTVQMQVTNGIYYSI